MARIAETEVRTLKIDGQDVSARADQTILEAAREAGIYIPAMCYMEGLSTIGACRLCLVHITGVNKIVPACVTPVAEEMEVTTDSEELRDIRRTIVEFLLAERNHVCSVCVSNGACELQDLTVTLGINHVRVPYSYPKLEVDSSHDYFRMDPNRCVLCTRCVRVCDEVEGAHTWDVKGRGYKSAVITDLNQAWGTAASCTECGKCVHVCPTGAITKKGTSVGEMIKRRTLLPYLNSSRQSKLLK